MKPKHNSIKTNTHSTLAYTLSIGFGLSLFTLGQTAHGNEAQQTAQKPHSSAKQSLSTSQAAATGNKTNTAADDSAQPLVTVYKSATCGCCSAWIDHMSDNGFKVEAHDTDNLHEYKVKAKLGAGMGSCHTAFVNSYAIEGHVPAADIKRLLKEKPDISGLTAPGMPKHSPGMAPKGSKPSGYDVISYKDGKTVGIFTKY